MSPRTGPRRPAYTFRISEEDIERIDNLAQTEGVNRSEMVRRLISEALGARHA